MLFLYVLKGSCLFFFLSLLEMYQWPFMFNSPWTLTFTPQHCMPTPIFAQLFRNLLFSSLSWNLELLMHSLDRAVHADIWTHFSLVLSPLRCFSSSHSHFDGLELHPLSPQPINAATCSLDSLPYTTNWQVPFGKARINEELTSVHFTSLRVCIPSASDCILQCIQTAI